MRCPRCTFPLRALVYEEVEVDHCDRCRGSFLDRGETAALFGADVEPESWTQAWPTTELGPQRIACPKDREVLNGFRVAFDKQQVEVDTCPECRGLWVDADEAVALQRIIEAAGKKARERQTGLDKPGAASYLFQLFTGLPVEAWNPVRRRPVLVHTLVGLLIAIFVLQVVFRDAMNADPGRLMMVPTQVLSGHRGWTLITSGFMHGGLAHLLGNLYFLWIFGDNVEDTLGKARFAVVYGGALLAGSVLHLVMMSSSEIPTLGASGAIAGLLGAYLVLFPKVRVYVVILFIRFGISAYWYLGFWIGLQVVMAALDTPGVAWWAHIGGFLAGAGLAYGFRGAARYSPLGAAARASAR